MECSEELGDMVKAADPTLALSGRKKSFIRRTMDVSTNFRL